ncbi:protein FAM83D [Takifugu rubripes]|uniref:Family with sequence similarity 83 member D n=1 Tax=Takifugu rubripes TaxID=31033 RepID=A0A3B5KLM7_TAKRU|nr:protein FAM83D [Takifugu rubripes]
MALSQLLDDSPLRSDPKQAGAEDLYNERHRLALEELLSGGLDCFLEFLRKEKLPNFLSDDEIRQIRGAAVSPRCVSLHGEDQGLEQSLSSSVDCSSVTYFPDVSDLEPPLLELGWPAFTAGSYRGVTRAVAHFQPNYGECIYGCKEAARRLIKSAREVIAIVTDSLTDLDIFKDLQEACAIRNVPVYVLLDQSCAPAFLKMCRNIGVCLDDLQQMRVRTITGTNFYMRSGVKVTGKVHERFMLIDGIKVATGSYRFDWTDGKLNSSNLVELSGQITEKFDEEFRILYAQSSPINARRPPGLHASLLLKHAATSSPQVARQKPADAACLTSTPCRKRQTGAAPPLCEPSTPEQRKANPADQSSTVDEPEHMQEEILAGNAAQLPPVVVFGHASTQASRSLTDAAVQTDFQLPRPDQNELPSPGRITQAPPDATFGERQRRYAVIRAKLEHMVTSLSERRELADANATAESHKSCSRPRTHKDDIQEPGRLP